MRIKQALYSRQLQREISLQIILPDDYENSEKKYPVLYCYDGDRIYDTPNVSKPSALSGSFEFGEYAAAYRRFLPQIILVGIAPPQDMWKRTAEYSPYTKKFDVPEGINFDPVVTGKGKLLGDWVVNVLKPWVDAGYRTLTEQKFTGVFGLSTGGVSALYMATAYPQIFSRVMLHAPAVHLWMDKLTQTVQNGNYAHIRYAYIDIGTDDCTRMVQKGEARKDILHIIELMKRGGLAEKNLRYLEIYRGTHECATWKLTFPDGLRWIFQDC